MPILYPQPVLLEQASQPLGPAMDRDRLGNFGRNG